MQQTVHLLTPPVYNHSSSLPPTLPPSLSLPPSPTLKTHVALLVVLPHQQVERGTRPRTNLRHSRAAVVQETGAKVSDLVRLLVEDEPRELGNDGALSGEDAAHDLCTLVGTHQVEEHLGGREGGEGVRM